jgi:hypothetical protein
MGSLLLLLIIPLFRLPAFLLHLVLLLHFLCSSSCSNPDPAPVTPPLPPPSRDPCPCHFHLPINLLMLLILKEPSLSCCGLIFYILFKMLLITVSQSPLTHTHTLSASTLEMPMGTADLREARGEDVEPNVRDPSNPPSVPPSPLAVVAPASVVNVSFVVDPPRDTDSSTKKTKGSDVNPASNSNFFIFLLKLAPMVYIPWLFIVAGIISFNTTMPVFLQKELGATDAVVGIVLSLVGVGRCIGSLPAGYFIKVAGVRVSAMVSGTVIAVASVMAALSPVAWVAGVASLLYGVAYTMLHMWMFVFLSKNAPPAQRGRTMSGMGTHTHTHTLTHTHTHSHIHRYTHTHTHTHTHTYTYTHI